jgi:hypothetical protein
MCTVSNGGWSCLKCMASPWKMSESASDATGKGFPNRVSSYLRKNTPSGTFALVNMTSRGGGPPLPWPCAYSTEMIYITTNNRLLPSTDVLCGQPCSLQVASFSSLLQWQRHSRQASALASRARPGPSTPLAFLSLAVSAIAEHTRTAAQFHS